MVTALLASLQAWEGRAYDYGMANLKGMGFPVDDLKFDPDLVIFLDGLTICSFFKLFTTVKNVVCFFCFLFPNSSSNCYCEGY